MKNLIEAVRWEVKEVNGERSIQLYDTKGKKINGSDAYWKGNFNCNNNQLTSLQGSPREVSGDFNCYNNQLTSLQGAPREVGGNFDCYNNQLTNLKGAPSEIGNGFYCPLNQLTSLEGAPEEVGGGFYCSDNQLTSLKGAPREVGGDFNCSHNQLTTLQGAPREVGGYFDCYNNQLTGLQDAPREVGGSFYCPLNQLTSLEGAPKEVGGDFYCSDNQLTSLKGAPRENSKDVAMRIFEAKLERGYVFADGILQKLIKQRKQGRYSIYKVQYIGSQKQSYVVQDGTVFNHGKTLKQAFEDLQYKIGDRDTSEYEKWTLDTKVNKTDMIKAYRKITGACSEGVRRFVESQELPSKVTVKQVITLTKNQYGHDEFKGFFK